MEVYGHRGSSGTEPENTLRAFRAALAAGARGVELDAHATRDGSVVVIHDDELARTTSEAGRVPELTLAEVQSADAGEGERVPLLTGVAALLAGQMTINVEIKQAGIEAAVLDVLAAHPALDWFISSFAWDTLRGVKRLQPAAPVWPLAIVADDALFAVAAELHSPGISLLHHAYTPEVAARCNEARLAVGLWTVNEIGDARRARDLGAALVMTDFPARIIAGLAAR